MEPVAPRYILDMVIVNVPDLVVDTALGKPIAEACRRERLSLFGDEEVKLFRPWMPLQFRDQIRK